MPELVYEKWGTRVEVCDETDERLMQFCFEGAKATAEGRGWEVLPGPVERIPAGRLYGDEACDTGEVVAYLWPVARPKNEWDLLDEALGPLVDLAALGGAA